MKNKEKRNIIFYGLILWAFAIIIWTCANEIKPYEVDAEICSLNDVSCEGEVILPETGINASEGANIANNEVLVEGEPVENYIKEPVGDIPNLIRSMAKDAGMSESEIEKFVRIADCESDFNPNAKNPNSSATGIFQIIKGTWESNTDYPLSDRLDAEKNIEVALHIWGHRGFQPWSSSNNCWK